MKNFAKGQYSISVNEETGMSKITYKGVKPQPRSLVLFNEKTNTVYCLVAKCRNTDKHTIIKCLAKAVLAEKRAKLVANSTKAVEISKNTVGNKISTALSASIVAVTDKDGHIIDGSSLNVTESTAKGRLSEIFKFNKSAGTIYDLVVAGGRSWEDKAVVNALNWWVMAAVQHLDYLPSLDAALGKAADSTKKEEDAKEKEEKDKAAKKAAAEAAKKAA